MGGPEIDEGSAVGDVDGTSARGADWLDWKQTTIR
jgi:hypothetical protein